MTPENSAPDGSPPSPRQLWLHIRTPTGLLHSGAVNRIRAEDLDGWFGILPGRPDIVSALPPGLLVFEDDDGEAFVANGGGTLDLRHGRCRTALRSAVLSRTPEGIGQAIVAQREATEKRSRAQHSVLDQLLAEALRRALEADPRLAEQGR